MHKQQTDLLGNAVNVNDLITAIEALQPSKQHQRQEVFSRSYEAIEAALQRNVSQKVLLGLLEDQGVAMSMGTFRKMLDDERRRRGVTVSPNGGTGEAEAV